MERNLSVRHINDIRMDIICMIEKYLLKYKTPDREFLKKQKSIVCFGGTIIGLENGLISLDNSLQKHYLLAIDDVDVLLDLLYTLMESAKENWYEFSQEYRYELDRNNIPDAELNIENNRRPLSEYELHELFWEWRANDFDLKKRRRS